MLSNDVISIIVIGTVIALLLMVFLFQSIVAKTFGAKAQPSPSVEIARLEQRSEFTGGGAAAAIAMVVFNGAAWLGYFAATTILQQTVAVLGAISASAFWGVFVIIGRRHTYRVMRDDPAAEKVEPKP